MKKQIEEMAKVIDDRLLEARNWLGSMNKGEGYWIAQELVKHYQPKNAVVLTKDIVDHIRKETAKEILDKFNDVQENLSKKIKQLKEPFNYVSMNSKEKEGYKNGILAAKSIVTSFKSQLAKQYGVEME